MQSKNQNGTVQKIAKQDKPAKKTSKSSVKLNGSR